MCDSYFFLVGRHFGLVGIETFVEGLGLPLTWGMAVLDVLLLLFSMFFIANQIFTDILMHFVLFFCTCYAIFVHLLCTFWHFLCISYARFMHFLCTFYALFMHFFMHFLCAFYAPLKSTFYALFKSAYKAHKKCMMILTKINKT